MCITAPGQIVALDAGSAVVETGGRRRRASTAVVPDVTVGEWVMVGAGTILRRIDSTTALELSRTIDAARSLAESRAERAGGQP